MKALCTIIGEMGNPFLEKSDYIVVLDSQDIMDPRVIDTVRTEHREDWKRA